MRRRHAFLVLLVALLGGCGGELAEVAGDGARDDASRVALGCDDSGAPDHVREAWTQGGFQILALEHPHEALGRETWVLDVRRAGVRFDGAVDVTVVSPEGLRAHVHAVSLGAGRFEASPVRVTHPGAWSLVVEVHDASVLEVGTLPFCAPSEGR